MEINLSSGDRFTIRCALISKARAHRLEADAMQDGWDGELMPATVAGDIEALRQLAARTLDLLPLFDAPAVPFGQWR